jgi:hypothetical protein
MIQNFKYKGFWYLPSAKENVIDGVLIYDPNNDCTLELSGCFEINANYFTKFKNEGIILGKTTDNRLISLYKCHIIKVSGLSFDKDEKNEKPYSIYSVKFVIEGLHFNSINEVKFNKVKSQIFNLDEWIGISGFKTKNINPEIKNNSEITLHYKLPEHINFEINDQYDGQFSFDFDMPFLINFEKKVTIDQKIELIISSKAEQTIEDLLKYLYRFHNFLIIALYNKTYPTQIKLIKSNRIANIPNEIAEIELFFSISNFKIDEKPKSTLNMLFNYDIIKEIFPKLIKNWYDKYNILEPAFNLLIDQFYNEDRFTENAFLNLAQSAETFHSRLKKNQTRMPKKEYDLMKKEIFSIVPDKFHEWLNDQFKFGNSLYLHNRLMDILITCSNKQLDQIVGDKELFVKQVKWSRNYYTHYSNDLKKNALKGKELYLITEKLKLVLVCAFLTELEVPKELLSKILNQNYYRLFNHII